LVWIFGITLAGVAVTELECLSHQQQVRSENGCASNEVS